MSTNRHLIHRGMTVPSHNDFSSIDNFLSYYHRTPEFSRQTGKTQITTDLLAFQIIHNYLRFYSGKRTYFENIDLVYPWLSRGSLSEYFRVQYGSIEEVYPVTIKETTPSHLKHHNQYHKPKPGHSWTINSLETKYVDGMELHYLRRLDIPDSYRVRLNLISKYRRWLPREEGAIDLVYLTKGQDVTDLSVRYIDEAPFIPKNDLFTLQQREKILNGLYQASVKEHLRSLGTSEADLEIRTQSIGTLEETTMGIIKPRMSGDQVLSYDWCSDKK